MPKPALPQKLVDWISCEAVRESFSRAIDECAASDFAAPLSAALLMFCEADSDARAKAMLRVTAKMIIEGGSEWAGKLSRPNCFFILNRLGDIEPDANPHLLTDGEGAMTRLIQSLSTRPESAS